MKILFISLYYFPEPVARPHDLAVTLTHLGYEVSVITTYPNYPHGQIYPNYRMGSARWEIINGVKVLRVPHIVDRSRSALRRVLSYTSFSLSAMFFGLWKTEKPDVIWTYQIGLPGVLLSRLRHVPLVHEVQDLWPDWGRAANLSGLRAGAYGLLERQEKWIYRTAQRVVTITEGFKQVLTQRGVKPGKLEIIPNWANDAVFHPADPNVELAETEGFTGFFNVVYIGNIGVAQALGVVLAAADQLRDLPEVQFTIIGDGVERAELALRAQTMRLPNVRFLGSRPQSAAAGYMALADVLLIHLKRDRVYEITVPSKTLGYLAAGRPILAAAEGEVARLIQKQQAGLVCPPEDAAALASSVRRLYAMPAEARQKMGQAGLLAVENLFSRAALGKEYSNLFEKVRNSYREEHT